MFGFKALDSLPRPSRSVKSLFLLSSVMVVVIISIAIAALWDMRDRELAHADKAIAGLSRILSDQTTRTFEGVALTPIAIISIDTNQRFEEIRPAAIYASARHSHESQLHRTCPSIRRGA